MWQAYELQELPGSCKPLLVFINTRSGPQTGLDLRRRFLRRLHPLQVPSPLTLPDFVNSLLILLFLFGLCGGLSGLWRNPVHGFSKS